MFDFLKSRKAKAPPPATETQEAESKSSWAGRLKTGLTKTRQQFNAGFENLVYGKKQLDADILTELETRLLSADVGVKTCDALLESLRAQISRAEINDTDALLTNLKALMCQQLSPYAQALEPSETPTVVLVVGVNGAGKTTSIAKMAHYYQQLGKKVILAAGDTFRAAAVQQLQHWGDEYQIPVIAQHTGADSASVIFDAYQAAIARHYELLLADTAGRLHTQDNLMGELEKIKRVLSKLNPNAPHETLLVVDASMGQNALNQARQFNSAIGIDSIALTKLDGTAKGGIIFAITNELKLPIRFIGVGEKIDDLRPFSAEEFVSALLG